MREHRSRSVAVMRARKNYKIGYFFVSSSSFVGKSSLQISGARAGRSGRPESLTLGQLGLTTGWLAEDGGAVAALDDGGGVGEDGAASQCCSAEGDVLFSIIPLCPADATPPLPDDLDLSNTHVIWKHPGHLTSMKNELGSGTTFLSLWVRA